MMKSKKETGWRRIRRILFVMLGFVFFALGAVGAVLPVLPTTPFLLLAAACFSRGSARFDAWFTSTKLYKRYLDSFVRERSMTMRQKITLCSFASIMLILAFILTPVLPARILIVAVIIFKYYYFIFRIKTVPEKSSVMAVTNITAQDLDPVVAPPNTVRQETPPVLQE